MSYASALPPPIAPAQAAPIASGSSGATQPAQRPRKRRRIVGEQLETLIAAFEVDDTPNAERREALAAQTGMTCVIGDSELVADVAGHAKSKCMSALVGRRELANASVFDLARSVASTR